MFRGSKTIEIREAKVQTDKIVKIKEIISQVKLITIIEEIEANLLIE